MLTAVRNYFSPPPPRAHEPSNREVLIFILKELRIMAIDVSKLNASIATLASLVAAEGTAIDTLIATHTDPAAQAAVDAAQVAVDAAGTAVSTKTAAINAALGPVPVPPAAA